MAWPFYGAGHATHAMSLAIAHEVGFQCFGNDFDYFGMPILEEFDDLIYP